MIFLIPIVLFYYILYHNILLALNKKVIMLSIITVLSIIHIISLLVAIISSFLLYRMYKNTGNIMTRHFFWFFVYVVAWMGMYFATIFATTGTFTNTSGWFPATSHGFFLVGLAYFARIFSIMVMPKYEKHIFWTTMIAAIAVIVLGLTLWGEAGVNPVTGGTSFTTDPLLLRVSAVISTLILLPSSILFFIQGRKSFNEVVKIRSYLISIGMFLLLWHGVSLVLVPFYGKMPWIIGEALNVLAFTILLIGILYRIPSAEENIIAS